MKIALIADIHGNFAALEHVVVRRLRAKGCRAVRRRQG
jgi:hypothetical protein